MPADLHIHTALSDGTNSPEEIVTLAKGAGLSAVSITDHDLVDAIVPAMGKGNELGVEVIPGIEFTTEQQETEIHILGYYFQYDHPALLAEIKLLQEDRVKRIYKIVDKLKGLNLPIEADDVFALARNKAPGRPHVARSLLKKGLVGSIKEAFQRYLANSGPAYVPHYKLSPKEAIMLIKKAGGLPVFAHPAVSACDQLIPELMLAGLRGIEVYYPGHSTSQVQHYQQLAQKYGLLQTGGSDYHGENTGRDIRLGDVSISDDLLDKIKYEHLHRN